MKILEDDDGNIKLISMIWKKTKEEEERGIEGELKIRNKTTLVN